MERRYMAGEPAGEQRPGGELENVLAREKPVS